MNLNRKNQPNNEINHLPSLENMAEENDCDEEYYDAYEEEDLPPYPAGEAYQAYCEDPTYNNAIEAAEEIWGIPDPRLIGLD